MRKWALLGTALGALVTTTVLMALLPGETSAQAPTQSVGIAQGPGGVWVVRGNKVYVCTQVALQVGTKPAAPQCGPPATLP